MEILYIPVSEKSETLANKKNSSLCGELAIWHVEILYMLVVTNVKVATLKT